MTALLEVRDVRVSYGRIEAVKGVSFSVDAGSLVTLIGSNGAGKTTVLRTISGLLSPTAGEVHFDGERIDQLPAHEIVERGIAHAPEGRRIFPRMSVQENLDLGAFTRTDGPAAVAGDLDERPTSASRCWASAGPRPRAPCRGASSRCWPSAGPSCAGPGCSCSTSRRWGCRRS